jgi:hypothetical protein
MIDSRNVGLDAIANRVRLVPEEFSIPGRCLRVLVDRYHDRLDVVIAPTFVYADPSDFSQGFQEGKWSFSSQYHL